MKICVVCQNYPSEAAPEVMAFTHARNLMYARAGHDVVVLNFSAKASYEWDGIAVWTEAKIAPQISAFDIMVFHAPNLRNHLRYMIQHRRQIRAKVLIAHGFEFITWLEQVGRPFAFRLNLKFRLRMVLMNLYDRAKIKIWARYIQSRTRDKLNLVFVSDWLRRSVEHCLGFALAGVANTTEINNPVHPIFLERRYQPDTVKDADFVTIRSFDEPKYAVDIVVEVARRNPQWTFHLFGYGEYFKHYEPPPNLTVRCQRFRQSQLPDLLDRYRAALLPTRWDSQGVLMCEMACFGMPLVVSDLPICHLMVGEFENVVFIQNEDPVLSEIPCRPLANEALKTKFAFANTVGRELKLFEHVAAGV